MRLQILLFLLASCLALGVNASAADYTYQLYLVRHAEKQLDDSPDPLLSDAGAQRAEQLADWFLDKDIREIWSSDYNRSRATAAPALSRLGLELKIYDPTDLASLSEDLLEIRQNAVIVGHSNTTPELARLLCDCDMDDMDESEYDRLIVISMVNGEMQVKTLHQGQLFKP